MTESSIYADFEIERKDLFRVSMYVAKRRLIIGLTVIASLIAGFYYFFFYIGEREILLQLSPLFVGLPLLGWGGQLLRLHAECRRIYSTIPESQRRVQYIFPKNSDGFDKTQGESFSHTAWNDVSRVIETPAYFLLYVNAYDGKILPKRAFQSHDLELFRELLLFHLGKKAKLLRQ